MADAKGTGAPLLPRLLVAISSWLVPKARRGDWRREWEGELAGRWDELSVRGENGVRVRTDLAWRALGSFIDATQLGGGGWTMDGTVLDLRLGVRNLGRRPTFSAVVILTLAVGIGSNAAIFALARDVLLRPFPYPDPDRVVAVSGYSADRAGFFGNVSYPNTFDLGEGATSLAGIAALRWWEPALASDDGSLVLRGATVTANFFEILGVEPGLGRFFRPEEEGSGRAPRVVISRALWAQQFGKDPGIVGRQIRLNGIGYEVIGVTSEGFEDPGVLGGPGSGPLIWRTVDSPPSEWPRSGRSWRAVGRVRAGATLPAAQQEVSAIMAGLEEDFPEHNAGRRIELTPIREQVAGPARFTLVTLLGSVGLLLMVACANLANLFLGRAVDRQREYAVQRALGASGWRLARKSLAETAVFAAFGGGLGLGFALGLGRLLVGLGPGILPRRIDPALDWTLLWFSLAVTLGTGFFFGVLPALQAARANPAVAGGSDARGHTTGRRNRGLQRSLVVVEVAMTAVLVVGAGLLLRSFQGLGQVDLGLDTEQIVTLELHGSAWWDLDQDAAAVQWHGVLETVASVPGVQEVGAMDYVPLGGSYSCDGVSRADRPRPPPGEGRCAETRSVLPGAVKALGIPLVRGRLLEKADSRESPLVIVIDAAMAEAFWPDEDPIGKPLNVHTKVHEVVGIVENIGHFGPGGIRRPTVYIPTAQEGWSGATRGLALVVRSAENPSSLVPAIRAAVWEVNPSIAFGEVHTLAHLLKRNLTGPKFRSFLLAAFGLTGILLASLGIGGVLAHSVSRRTREMGIRMAVGASPGEVMGLVIREGLTLTGVGLILGLMGAAALGQFVRSLLFEVSAVDPLVFLSVPVVLALAGAVASLAPALKAASVDVGVSLNSD